MSRAMDDVAALTRQILAAAEQSERLLDRRIRNERLALLGVLLAVLSLLLAACDSTPTRPVVIREPIEVRVPVPVMPPVPAELAGALTIDPRLRVVAPSDPAAVVGLTEEAVRGLRRTVIECQSRDADWRAAWGRGSP